MTDDPLTNHSRKYDVMIVLGGPMESSDRLKEAVRAYRTMEKKGNLPYVIVTDFMQYENMHEYLKDSGVAEGRIIKEPYATTTRENIRYSMEICERMNLSSALFVTSYYQCKRLVKNANNMMGKGTEFGWTYEMPDFRNLREDVFMFGRFLREFVATVREDLSHGDMTKSPDRQKMGLRTSGIWIPLMRLEHLAMKLFGAQ